MNFVIPQPVYDVLKWVALVLLPALATFYFYMAGVWNWPYAGQVVASITAVNTLLGAILGISSSVYKNSDQRFDGTLNILKTDTSLVNQLDIQTDPSQLGNQKALTLRVNKIDAPGVPPVS